MTDDPTDPTPLEVARDHTINAAWNRRTRGVGGQAEFGPTPEFVRQAAFIFNQAVEWQRAQPLSGDASDGNHTFDELYEYRMVYHAQVVNLWDSLGYEVVKSWRHHDGEECFGGGWFIVTAQLPTGQVSNHYQAEHWDLFALPEVAVAPEWDGHTPQVALDRMRAML